jgi:glycosyltransferase involved in cell wall biosynthesis
VKIVSVNVHYQDKLGYQDYYLGKALMNLGHEVIFVTSDRHFDYPDYEKTVQHIIGSKYVGVGTFINDYGAKVHRLPIDKLIYAVSGKIRLKNFLQKIQDIQPDLIISHNILTFQSLALANIPESKRPILVYDDHTTVNLLNKKIISQLLYAIFRSFFAKKIYHSAKRIVGISDTCIDVINKEFGMKGDKVEMIPLGADLSVFYPNPNLREQYRKEILKVNENDVVITYTGKIYALKSVVELIDTVSSLKNRFSYKVLLHIVGDVADDYREAFEKSMAQSAIPILYNKALPTQELAKVYNGSDLCVWPNHLTNSTVDASACGCAIICSSYMPERVKYNNGIAIKPGDTAELSNALISLVNNPEERKIMGERGLDYVKAELSWESIAKKFIY